MLRASSLGLSLPPPTIFAIHQCRRLCGARNRWALAQSGRNVSTSTPASFPPALPTHPKRADQENADENLRDVAALLSPSAGERKFGPNASFVYLEAVEETDTSTPPAGAVPPDTDTPDRTLELEVEREEFLKLIHEELEMADVLSEIPPAVAWAPSSGGKLRSTDAVKPVEISQSLYAPLTQLIAHLKTAHREEETATTVESDELAAPDPLPLEPLPPRDTVAQIWKNLQILGRTMSTDDAWTAYIYLIDTLSEYPRVQEHFPQIPFSHLQRFCRVLSRARPKTHRQFLHLLSVLTYIKHCGGELKHWALNALVDLAGKGWRKTHPEVIAKQKEVLNDLLAGRMPGASEYAPEDQQTLLGPAFKPDVYTLTSLITVAARGGDTATLRELSVLMNKCRLTPNRVTHIAMLQYYVQKQDLTGLRATLQRMRQLNIDLGVEGLNACISAYSRLQKLDVVLMIYRLLRHNIIPEVYRGENDVVAAGAQLSEEFIFIEEDTIADKITYVSVIQAMTYHGHFRAAMEIFIDMLSLTQPPDPGDSVELESSPDVELPLDADSSPEDPPLELELPPEESLPCVDSPLDSKSSLDAEHPSDPPTSYESDFEPTIAVYRAIFIGFARHAVPPSSSSKRHDWTLENLRNIFARFLLLPADTHITQAQLWMILDAFGKTSGWDHDELREVWGAIDRRFRVRLHRPHGNTALARLRRTLFPDGDQGG